ASPAVSGRAEAAELLPVDRRRSSQASRLPPPNRLRSRRGSRAAPGQPPAISPRQRAASALSRLLLRRLRAAPRHALLGIGRALGLAAPAAALVERRRHVVRVALVPAQVEDGAPHLMVGAYEQRERPRLPVAGLDRAGGWAVLAHAECREELGAEGA